MHVCVYMCACVRIYMCGSTCVCVCMYMHACPVVYGPDRLIQDRVSMISRFLKIIGLFAEEPYKRDDILQKRPII